MKSFKTLQTVTVTFLLALGFLLTGAIYAMTLNFQTQFYCKPGANGYVSGYCVIINAYNDGNDAALNLTNVGSASAGTISCNADNKACLKIAENSNSVDAAGLNVQINGSASSGIQVHCGTSTGKAIRFFKIVNGTDTEVGYQDCSGSYHPLQ